MKKYNPDDLDRILDEIEENERLSRRTTNLDKVKAYRRILDNAQLLADTFDDVRVYENAPSMRTMNKSICVDVDNLFMVNGDELDFLREMLRYADYFTVLQQGDGFHTRLVFSVEDVWE